MINSAGCIDNIMPHRMSVKIKFALNRKKKSVNGSSILFLGVAYKPDINDERESPVLKVMDEVARKLGNVMYHDPYIPWVTTEEGREYTSVQLYDDLIEQVDCVVFATNHSFIQH